MPPKRRTTGPTARSSNQAMLTFHGRSNKVTKPSTAHPSHKIKPTSPTSKVSKPTPKTKTDPALLESAVPTSLPAVADPDLSEPTTADAALVAEAQDDAVAVKTELSAEEEAARKVTDAQVKRYWRAKEQSRKAARVHQEDVSLHEKVLREWDMMGGYGPCMGIPRLRRWKRAHKLGLNPPIEVLAVLLREQNKDNLAAQRAHVDELMNSRFVET